MSQYLTGENLAGMILIIIGLLEIGFSKKLSKDFKFTFLFSKNTDLQKLYRQLIFVANGIGFIRFGSQMIF